MRSLSTPGLSSGANALHQKVTVLYPRPHALAEAAPAAPAAAPMSAPLVEETVGPNAVLDAAIKRAVICGEFEGAVDCCFRFGRMADALLLAATGGRELFQRTQERYLALNASQPFVKVTRSIVNHQLQTLVFAPPSSPPLSLACWCHDVLMFQGDICVRQYGSMAMHDVPCSCAYTCSRPCLCTCTDTAHACKHACVHVMCARGVGC